MIFEELIRFSQRDRQMFPSVRFQKILKHMTLPQKEDLFKKVKHELGNGKTIFQLRLMFNLEIEEDPDDENSRNHRAFEGDLVEDAIKKAEDKKKAEEKKEREKLAKEYEEQKKAAFSKSY